MKFIIHSLKLRKEAEDLERQLGEGCYIPGRDTKQAKGDDILRDNLAGMLKCDDDVYVVWDGSSLGTVFDMGMAFALGKTIHPTKIVHGRSWPNYFAGKVGSTIKHESTDKKHKNREV